MMRVPSCLGHEIMTFRTKRRSHTITTQSQPIETARHHAVHTTDITQEQQQQQNTEHAKNLGLQCHCNHTKLTALNTEHDLSITR